MKTKIFSILAVLAILIMALPGSVMADPTVPTVGLTTTVVDYVPTINFSVLPTTLTFHAIDQPTVGVTVGQDSDVEPFIITNNGDSINIELITLDTFYRNRMQLSFDNVTWYSYDTTLGWDTLSPVPHLGTLTVYLKVHPLAGDAAVSIPGTLTCLATLH